jgi:hypothetical protein
MNGSSYYSPPSRHTRCLGDRFIEGDAPKERTNLEEFPFLVAKAIAAGLIKLPSPEEQVEPEPTGAPISDWRKISCIKCGEVFIRGWHHIEACSMCRLDKRKCLFPLKCSSLLNGNRLVVLMYVGRRRSVFLRHPQE